MKTTKEMIAIMQAYEDGQPVQYKTRRHGYWVEVITPSWDWKILVYRVKPAEPKKVKKWILKWKEDVDDRDTWSLEEVL